MATVSKRCFHCQRKLAPGEAPLLIALPADDRCIILCADCAADTAVASRFAQTAQRGRLATDDTRQAASQEMPYGPIAAVETTPAIGAQARARHAVVAAETALAQAITSARDAEAAVARSNAVRRQRPTLEHDSYRTLSAPCLICGVRGASGTVALRRGKPISAFSRLCPDCDDAGEIRQAFITTIQLFQPQGIVYSASTPNHAGRAESPTDY
jgi:hypothetical protein